MLEAVAEPRDAGRVAERIVKGRAGPIQFHGSDMVVSAGVGIPLGSPDDDHPRDLLRRADLAVMGAWLTIHDVKARSAPLGCLEQLPDDASTSEGTCPPASTARPAHWR